MNTNKAIKLICLMVIVGSMLQTAQPAYAQTKGADEQALSKRLQVLEDKEAIRSMLEHYIELNESKDWLGYSHLFAIEGELVMGSGTLHGPDAIYAELEKNFGKDKISADSFLNRASHLLSNIQINIKGDTATAVSRWTLLVPGEKDVPTVSQAGKYRDQFVRENGEWRFKQRAIVTDLPAAK